MDVVSYSSCTSTPHRKKSIPSFEVQKRSHTSLHSTVHIKTCANPVGLDVQQQQYCCPMLLLLLYYTYEQIQQQPVLLHIIASPVVWLVAVVAAVSPVLQHINYSSSAQQIHLCAHHHKSTSKTVLLYSCAGQPRCLQLHVVPR